MSTYANHICNSGGQTHGPQVEVLYELPYGKVTDA